MSAQVSLGTRGGAGEQGVSPGPLRPWASAYCRASAHLHMLEWDSQQDTCGAGGSG